MHFDYPIPDLLVFTTLNSTKYFDGDPFFFALHEGCHDLGDSILVERFRLDVVDIFLIVLTRLLLARPLCNSGIPSISVIDAKCFDGDSR